MSLDLAVHDYASALQFLLSRINYERTPQIPYRDTEFRLDRMQELLGRLGNPHLSVPCVHIAGTKGKGSTASMIAAVLENAGLRTGLYTSPHLDRIEERFAIDGQPCPSEELLSLTRSVEPIVREMDEEALVASQRQLTFFEVTTAIAFLHFARQEVDFSVLEVGLGGRLDSTNVCRPAVSVITSISYDHTRQLGSTLAAIAGEKAGIIKPQVPVVSGVVSDEPRAVIRDVAQNTGAPVWERERDFEAVVVDAPPLTGPTIDYRDTLAGAPYQLSGIRLNLLGDHQAANAATAMAAIRLLTLQGWNLPEAAIRQGLSHVRCPARVEVVRRHPTVILDSAHNVASMEALCQALHDAPASKRVLVFATSRDKDLSGMLRILLPAFDEVIVTCYLTNPRARTAAECFEAAQEERTRLDEARRPALHEAEEPLAAWQLARSLAGDDGLVCITGSFFLAAELRSAASQEKAS